MCSSTNAHPSGRYFPLKIDHETFEGEELTTKRSYEVTRIDFRHAEDELFSPEIAAGSMVFNYIGRSKEGVRASIACAGLERLDRTLEEAVKKFPFKKNSVQTFNQIFMVAGFAFMLVPVLCFFYKRQASKC